MVLVLGMHRSGTSALTRCLGLLGAALPRTLLAAGPDNPQGFWESEPVNALNDAILAAGGSDWHDWRRFEVGRLAPGVRREIEGRIAEVVAAEFGDAPLFVLKDPRMCRLLPLWLPVLAGMGIGVQAAIATRHPGAVARSLTRRNGFPAGLGVLLWLRHVLDAERDTRGLPRAFVSYERLLAGWRPALLRAGSRMGLAWPVSPDAVGDAGLEARAVEEREAETGSVYAEVWARHAWGAVRGFEEGEAEAGAQLDRVRGQFEDAAGLFGAGAEPRRAPAVGRVGMPEVTLCAADSVFVPLTERAVARSAAACAFGGVALLTAEGLESREAYSAFVLKGLLAHVQTSHALLVQWDGFVVGPEVWDPGFLAFDYIGARWPWQAAGTDVGNGGFSLRSRRLLEVLAGGRFMPVPGVPEDELICRVWRPVLEREHGIRFAPGVVADRFSYERVQGGGPTFGFHGLFNVWRYLSVAELVEMAALLPGFVLEGREWAELVAGCVTGRRDAAAALLARWGEVAPAGAIGARLAPLLGAEAVAWAVREVG